MKKFLFLITLISFIFVTACTQNPTNANGTSSESNSQTELTIAAAASLTDVTKELAVKYNETNPNTKLTFTYGSSGALQTQIEEGAPVDVFMSASKKQMTALDEKKLILEGTYKDLVKNQVVLIVPADSSADISSFNDCATDKVKIVALGDPKTTPAGQYAQEMFEKLGIWDSLGEKINLATDVRQVLSWVETGEADCGLVFKTDAMASDKVKTAALPPAEVDKAADYPVGIINATKVPDEAKKFEEFLFSNDSKAIFEKFGFETSN